MPINLFSYTGGNLNQINSILNEDEKGNNLPIEPKLGNGTFKEVSKNVIKINVLKKDKNEYPENENLIMDEQ